MYKMQSENFMGRKKKQLIETPENDFGYTDTVLFNHEKAYTLNRYLQNWILKAITEALIKKGYIDYMQ